MSKKVLIVEASLAVRNIAESLLRQSSYEVVSAETSQAAREIIQTSRIDLILSASDISEADGRKFYEALGADTATAALPLLILHDPTAGDLDYPPEAIINKPFTPREFLDKVNAFTGGKELPTTSDVSPFSESAMEDELIDQALGLDKLEVDQAEVMGNDTGVFRIMNKKVTQESMIGFEFKAEEDTGITDAKKKGIDEVNIPADQKSNQVPTGNLPEFLGQDSKQINVGSPQGLSESSKIEIVTDQYGIVDPQQFEEAQKSEGGESHDYNWFVSEMKREGAPESPSDSGSLKIEPTSQNLDPVAPIPLSESAPQPSRQSGSTGHDAQNHSQAVDKFISEFKKEMEKIAEDAVPDLPDIPISQVLPDPPPSDNRSDKFSWEEAIEKIAPADIKLMSEELITVIARQVAEQIMLRIDPDTIYRIIQNSLQEILAKNLKSKTKQHQ